MTCYYKVESQEASASESPRLVAVLFSFVWKVKWVQQSWKGAKGYCISPKL